MSAVTIVARVHDHVVFRASFGVNYSAERSEFKIDCLHEELFHFLTKETKRENFNVKLVCEWVGCGLCHPLCNSEKLSYFASLFT